jgi:hypothetical protein
VQLVTFVTRAGCTMCAEALPVVQREAARAGVRVEVLDVDAEPGLTVWSEHVPVVLVDGVEHSRWWVDGRTLRTALSRRS